MYNVFKYFRFWNYYWPIKSIIYDNKSRVKTKLVFVYFHIFNGYAVLAIKMIKRNTFTFKVDHNTTKNDIKQTQ